MVQRKNKEQLQWLEFDLLAGIPGLVHGVFLRHGGVSGGCYGSLNVGVSSDDLPGSVAANRGKIAEALELSRIVFLRQVHGKKVWVVPGEEPLGDGLISNREGIGLLVQHADCQAALFYDPIHQAIGSVHSGWRGSVLNIYEETVHRMRREFGTNPADLLVGISPSLGPKAAQFVHYKEELPPSFWEFQVQPDYFDFWAISRMQLQQAGVLPHHIEIASICTYGNPQDWFSYRRDKVMGCHGSVIGLAKS